MKKLKVLLLPLVVMLFAACDPDDFQHPDVLKGHWVLVSNEKESALMLDFNEYQLNVKNGSYDYRPFTTNGTWDYRMNKDSVLFITRPDNSSESYKLDLSFSNSFNHLRLTYKQSFHSDRTYNFIRR